MFDIGFAELLIIGVVALIVIGPERLPGAVRSANTWISRIRKSFNDIKRDVQQELHNDAVLRDLRESGEQLKRETQALRQEAHSDPRRDERALADPPGDEPAGDEPAGEKPSRD